MTERGMVMMKAKRSKSACLGNSSSLADPDDIAQYMIQKKGRIHNTGVHCSRRQPWLVG